MHRLLYFLVVLLLTSCSIQKQLSRSAKENVLGNKALVAAHVGISVYEPATGKYWYDFQGDKYFVPASNTKIPTCYAAMKYLGDSLVAARLAIAEDSILEIYPSGDPTFLNSEYSYQPLLTNLKGFKNIRWDMTGWKSRHWGNGWSWNDYDAAYMAERSPLPIYGNLMMFYLSGDTIKSMPVAPEIYYSYDTAVGYNPKQRTIKSKKFLIDRSLENNTYRINSNRSVFSATTLPFRTDPRFISKLLKDIISAENVSTFQVAEDYVGDKQKRIIYSQPTDSLLKPMMHRSDNFFAEQVLLMVSNELLGEMNDAAIIDTLLKTDFKDLPQKPRWADGSGLSRYNLFTPQDLVAILNKMKNEFGMERVKVILPTGGEGTISNYYKAEAGYLYAKTGTLSGVVALSGYLTTKKNKQLIFSVLVNNHQASATDIRKAVEKFIKEIRNKY